MTAEAQSPALDDGRRLQLLIDAVTDYAIYMLDPAGFVVSWNSGAQKLKGYRPTEIIGQHFSRFFTPEDQAAGLPAKALREAQAQGRFEAEGLAGPQGRQPLLGERHRRADPRRARDA